jgi:hypothetical protein
MAGPFFVIGIDCPHVTVRTREEPQEHYLYRVIRAPISDPPPGFELLLPESASNIGQREIPPQKFVVERVFHLF